MFVPYYTSGLTVPLKEKTCFMFYSITVFVFSNNRNKGGHYKSDLHTNAAPLGINLIVYICKQVYETYTTNQTNTKKGKEMQDMVECQSGQML